MIRPLRFILIIFFVAIIAGCSLPTVSHKPSYGNGGVFNVYFDNYKNNYRVKFYSSEPERLSCYKAEHRVLAVSLYKPNNKVFNDMETYSNHRCNYLKYDLNGDYIIFYYDCPDGTLVYPEYGRGWFDIILTVP